MLQYAENVGEEVLLVGGHFLANRRIQPGGDGDWLPCGTLWNRWTGVGLVEYLLEVCERLFSLLFLFCFDCVAGKTGIGERCWSRWGVIECEFGVAVWLVRWCSVVVFDWCVRFYFWVWLAVVFVFSYCSVRANI